MAHLYVFWNEIWPWHIGRRWAIVALWATCYHCQESLNLIPMENIFMRPYCLWITWIQLFPWIFPPIFQNKITDERAKKISTNDGETKVTFTATVGLDNFYLQYEVKVGAFNIYGDGPNSTVTIIYSAEGSEYFWIIRMNLYIHMYSQNMAKVHFFKRP